MCYYLNGYYLVILVLLILEVQLIANTFSSVNSLFLRMTFRHALCPLFKYLFFFFLLLMSLYVYTGVCQAAVGLLSPVL